jgi:hypothetical protein
MKFTFKWIEKEPEKDFWNLFEEDKTLPKELLISHFQSPNTDTKPIGVSVYYALLCNETEIGAGCIFIYFPHSNSLLIRHLFIKESFQKEFDLSAIDPSYTKLTDLFSNKPVSFAEQNEQNGIPYLLTRIWIKIGEPTDKPIFIFGETVNVLQAQTLSLEEHKRLNKLHRFYAAIKAKNVQTDQYDRPRIRDEFNNLPLSLLNFPELYGQPFIISIPIILSFVEEYIQFIISEGNKNDNITEWTEPDLLATIAEMPTTTTGKDLQKKELPIKNKYLDQLLLGLIKEKYAEDKSFIYMQELPRLEDPKISFKRASVCFELMVDEDYYDPTEIEEKQKFFKIVEEEREQTLLQKLQAWNWGKHAEEKESELTREEKINKILTDGYCIIHHSFETDLLAYKYQAIPPFFTKNYRPGQLVTIQFPESSDFISEGRKEKFYTLPIGDKREIKMTCFVNYSYFLNSRMRVWHIVLRSSEENPVSEFDIIKLMKFFSGSQESISEVKKKEALTDVKFRIDEKGHEFLEFLDFFKQISGVHYKRQNDYKDNTTVDESLSLLKNIKTGIIQLDSKYINLEALVDLVESTATVMDDPEQEDTSGIDNASQQTLTENLKKFHANLYQQINNLSSEDENKAQDPFENIEYVLKTYCAIALGIFDFERMGGQEVADTLQPRPDSLDKAYFLTVNRGVITSYSIDDDVLNATWNTLGINPYLVIPSAVLVHNEYVSTDADNRLTRVLERSRDKNAKSIRLGELIEERNYIDDLVNDDILSNVFQYPSEQDLYDYGMKHRGINERIRDTKAKLSQLDKIIEQVQSQKSIYNERLIQIVLAILSLFQIASFFADYEGLPEDQKNWTFSFILGLGTILIYLIFFRNTKVRIKKPKKNGKQNKKS